MFRIAAKYDWLGVHFCQMLPMSLPVALPPFTPMAATHKTTHTELIRWFTAGFL